ncbi:MAG: tail fiber protein [Proteobacteria bacterium]|nr:tail fiber protein [Pseudomonadota bacterium]NBP13553.1 tail fiber protein [bacterium]
MGLLDKLKGFVKLSEISTDNAHPLLDTEIKEDANTVFTQIANAMQDALRKQSLIVTSTGTVTWNSNKITPDFNTNIVIKFLQNTNGQVVNLVLNYADFAAGVNLSNDGDVFYIELNRNLLTSGNINIYNGGGTAGQRAVVGSGMPILTNNQSGPFQGTICIPIAVRQGTNLWWNPSGFYWTAGTSGFIGSIGTTDIVPSGTIMPFSGNSASIPTGYSLCDGSLKSAALYPALASLYWDGTNYLYGGSGFAPGPTPNGNFNLPDLRGLFVKGAGVQNGLINGKQYSATLADTQPDRTAVNALSIDYGNNHRHSHFSVFVRIGNYMSAGNTGNYWYWYGAPDTVTAYDGTHNHSLSSGIYTQTHPAHMGLNYIIKL